jgi:hypothetical protein
VSFEFEQSLLAASFAKRSLRPALFWKNFFSRIKNRAQIQRFSSVIFSAS